MNSLCSEAYDAYSAGSRPAGVNPLAVKALKEINIDISGHRSKGFSEFKDVKFDCVVTLCEEGLDTCPFFPGGAKYIHKAFKDPVRAQGTQEDILMQFRQARDDIKEWIIKQFCGKKGEENA
jgi:arsenate reductase